MSDTPVFDPSHRLAEGLTAWLSKNVSPLGDPYHHGTPAGFSHVTGDVLVDLLPLCVYIKT